MPSAPHVVNGDDQAYRLRIGELVAPTDIPADQITTIGCTTPSVRTYTGELLPAAGDQPLATIPVVEPLAALAP